MDALVSSQYVLRGKLCESCSRISFNRLRHPTVGEIETLNAGRLLEGERFPLKHDESRTGMETWSLGCVSRIRKSANTCPFCAAVVAALQQEPRVLKNLASAGVEDPVCHVAESMDGYLIPPEGRSWQHTYPEREGHGRFFLSRLGLKFYPDDEDGHIPELNRPRYPWMSLMGCFQTYCTESEEAFPEVQKCFDQPKDTTAVLFAGRKRPAYLEAGLPLQWLSNCLNNHNESCGAASRDSSRSSCRMPVFRLIDVDELKVVDFTNVDLELLTYAALSYVWGKPGEQRIMLLRSNYDELHEGSALAGKVPRTIADAIQFTKSMGQRYIWVDAICIIQDKGDVDKDVQLSNMGNVYACSLFTIIAADGEGADSGLPGLSKVRQKAQVVVEIELPDQNESINLVTALTPTAGYTEHLTKSTVWASRGWTLQERALARRTVTFLNEQVLWACCGSSWSEETNCESQLARVSWYNLENTNFSLQSVLRSLDALDFEADQFWLRFSRLVNDYSKRELTGQGDGFDAFSAVLQQAQAMSGNQFLWGIPESRFELGLCWEPVNHGPSRRSSLTTRKSTSLQRRVPFPSWSWMGWRGAIKLPIEDKDADIGLVSAVDVYVLRNTPLRIVLARRLFADIQGRVNASLAHSTSAISLKDIQKSYPKLELQDIPDDQILVFKGESTRFRVTKPVKFLVVHHRDGPLQKHRYGRYRQQLLDIDGNIAGQTGPCLESQDASEIEDKEYEFIVIAERTAPPDFEKQRIALQVERRPDGVVYRVNIADISQDAWEKATKSEGLVVLGSEIREVHGNEGL